jgi:hypothetical protein
MHKALNVCLTTGIIQPANQATIIVTTLRLVLTPRESHHAFYSGRMDTSVFLVESCKQLCVITGPVLSNIVFPVVQCRVIDTMFQSIIDSGNRPCIQTRVHQRTADHAIETIFLSQSSD